MLTESYLLDQRNEYKCLLRMIDHLVKYKDF